MTRVRLATTVLALLFLARVASAQGNALDQRYKLGEVLGAGDYKVVYAVVDHPELALGVAKYEGLADKFQEEKTSLDRLAKSGVPTVKLLELGTYGNKAAYVLERYAVGTKSGERRFELLNETSIADLKTIDAALAKAHLEVTDLQFLVGEDGHLVVGDPDAVLENASNDANHRAIEGLLRTAREAVLQRDLMKKIALMPGARDDALARYFRERIVEADPGDKGASLTAALLHYLETGDSTDAARAVAKAVRGGSLKVAFANRWEGLDPGEVFVELGRNFPTVAADLVRAGTKALENAGSTLEGDVVGLAHALSFLRVKKAPEGVDRKGPTDASIGDLGPRTLVDRLAAGTTVDPAERARLEGRAKAILDRGPRTPGITAVLGRERDEARPGAEDR
jgi:hypothetical protein